jgi:hypothetical protein
MPLHGDSHGRQEPPGVPMTTQPTAFQCADGFDHPLPRLHGLSTLAAPLAVHRSGEDFKPLLTFHRMVTMATRGGQPGHPALALKLGTQRLIIRFPIHDDRLNYASQLPGFQPPAVGFIRTIASGLAGPQDAWLMRHQTARARPVYPPPHGGFGPTSRPDPGHAARRE